MKLDTMPTPAEIATLKGVVVIYRLRGVVVARSWPPKRKKKSK